MRRHDGAPSDASVDLYRSLLATNAAIGDAEKRITTPGAGADPRKVIKPSKRLRNWHRSSPLGLSLKAYARNLASQANGGPVDRTSMSSAAHHWLASKGVRR